MVTCKICAKEFMNLSSHINSKHSISKEEYLTLYPGASIISAELSDRFSKRAADTHRKAKEADYEKYMEVRNRTCEKMRANKGANYTHSDTTITKMKESAKVRPERVPHTEETKKKLSEQKIGKPVNLTEEAKQLKTEKQKKQWEKRKENTEEFKIYLDKLSAGRIDYIKKHGVSLPRKGKITSLENRFIEFLKQNNINYVYQFFLEGKNYDFLLPDKNLLVEVDGEYWHRFPQAIKNDIEKHAIAKSSNYKLLRITELVWKPELIFENDYNDIIEHNHKIINERTKTCQAYEISISMI